MCVGSCVRSKLSMGANAMGISNAGIEWPKRDRERSKHSTHKSGIVKVDAGTGSKNRL